VNPAPEISQESTASSCATMWKTLTSITFRLSDHIDLFIY